MLGNGVCSFYYKFFCFFKIRLFNKIRKRISIFVFLCFHCFRILKGSTCCFFLLKNNKSEILQHIVFLGVVLWKIEF